MTQWAQGGVCKRQAIYENEGPRDWKDRPLPALAKRRERIEDQAQEAWEETKQLSKALGHATPHATLHKVTHHFQASVSSAVKCDHYANLKVRLS